jgi:zinc protease
LSQSEPDQIERQLHAAERLRAVTPQAVQAAARRYLAPGDAVRITVLPDPAPTAATATKSATTNETGFVSRNDVPHS